MKNSDCGNDKLFIALVGYYNTPKLPMGSLLKRMLQMGNKNYYERQTTQLSDLLAGENVRTQRGEIWKPAVVLLKHEHLFSFVALAFQQEDVHKLQHAENR